MAQVLKDGFVIHELIPSKENPHDRVSVRYDDLDFETAELFAHILAYEHAERIYPLTYADMITKVVNAMSVHFEFYTSNGTRVVYEARA